jgi:sugar-specific transcriptional regulator TrmB
MMEIDKDVLRELGLTNNEVDVYLKLLMSGSVTVNTLAERTGMHRQACYDALDRLLEKGFVSFVIKNNKKNFQALPPEQLIANVLQKSP